MLSVKATAEAMEVVSVIRDMGQSWSTVVHGGGSAALGVMQRLGLGRLRQVDLQLLNCTEPERVKCGACEGVKE